MAQNVKTVQGLAIASVKACAGLPIASAKAIMGVDNTGGGGFVPTDIAGCQLWLDASQEAFANNDPVGTATDWSGQGHNATQGTAGQQPTFKTNIINGLPVFRFDGTADNLGGIATSNAARTVFIVLQKRSAVTGDSQVAISFNNTITAVIFTNSGFFASGYGWYAPATAIGGTVTNPNILGMKFSSASSVTPYVNGTAGTPFDPDNDYSSGNAFRLGSTDTGPNNPSDIDIAEVIIYDTALSDSDRDSVESYLGTKYGITVA